MVKKEAQKEFNELLEQARQRTRRAVWAEAKALYDRASDARFKDFPAEELTKGKALVTEALAAPPGMVYVPAGKFTMGGGEKSQEWPEGETETAAFYIDDREVTVAQYAEFLAVLDGFGHTPACPKEEPPNKKHVPLDWETQKGTESVSGVDWWDALSYSRWRKKRLPREAEWVMAAGFDPAGRRFYPWGPKYLKEGGKSYLGLEGMGSGVVEWTADPFVKYPWGSSDESDFSERKKALRGGVRLAEDAERHASVVFRHSYPPNQRTSRVGFRCVQDVPEK